MEPDSSQWSLVTGHKLKYKKFHLNIRENLFSCEGDCTLEQVAARGCGVSVLGDIKNPTGHGPGQPAVVDTTLSRRAGLDLLQRYLPISTPLSFCELCSGKSHFPQAVNKAGPSPA